jgi:hypothetical protein
MGKLIARRYLATEIRLLILRFASSVSSHFSAWIRINISSLKGLDILRKTEANSRPS